MRFPKVKKAWMIQAEEQHGVVIDELLPAWFNKWGAEETARRLGVDSGTVYYWLREWGYTGRKLVKQDAVAAERR